MVSYKEGFEYSVEVKAAVRYGYMYRKEAEQYEDFQVHHCLPDISDVLCWLAEHIIDGIAWNAFKDVAKTVFSTLTEDKIGNDKILSSIFADEAALKEFYQDVKEFNEQRMSITKKQFQYIREEIEADVIGEELGKIYSREKREPTIQEIKDANKKAKQKADKLLGYKYDL